MPSVDGGALCNREIRLEPFERADCLAAIPGRQQIQHPGAYRGGLEHAAIEQHGGGHQRLPTGARPNQGVELVARDHILQAAGEEAGQVLADHRIGRIGQTEFLQPGPTRLARQIVEGGLGEEPVEDDLREQGAIEHRGNCLGKQARPTRRNCDRRFGERGVIEQGDLRPRCRVHQRQELPGIQRLAFGLQSGLQGVGKCQIHVVATEQDVLADADALQLQIAGDIRHGDQAEIGGAAADIAHQNDVAGRHRIAPLPAGLRGPRVEGRLRLLEQRDVAQPGRRRRFGRQAARNLVERGGDRYDDLAVGKAPTVCPWPARRGGKPL